jgi:ABC-type sulfate/molybdate transport systems ATPase subunit
VVFVTHDLEEAIALADVFVLTGGPAKSKAHEIDLPRRGHAEICYQQRSSRFPGDMERPRDEVLIKGTGSDPWRMPATDLQFRPPDELPDGKARRPGRQA